MDDKTTSEKPAGGQPAADLEESELEQASGGASYLNAAIIAVQPPVSPILPGGAPRGPKPSGGF